MKIIYYFVIFLEYVDVWRHKPILITLNNKAL